MALGVLHGTADRAEGDEDDEALKVLVVVSARLSDAVSASGLTRPVSGMRLVFVRRCP